MGKSPATSDDTTDRELLARHCTGDPQAFGELVARHRDRLWRVALRTLGDADDAADAVQDAFVSAFRSAAGYRGDAAVTTWLHRIVVNACLDLARRRAARPTSPLADSAALTIAAPDTLGDRETAAEILAALRELPTEQAIAIVLVDVEGYPVADVADILEVPTGTVKSRCARGRARLAQRLQHLAPRNPAAHLAVQPDAVRPQPGRRDDEQPDDEKPDDEKEVP